MHYSALRQFLGWCEGLAYSDPAGVTRARLEAYQLFLFHYRSPRGGKALAINTQLARLGCIRRFFAWLCRDGILPANPASDLDLPRKQARSLPKSLSPDEIDRLLALPDTASPFGLRDRTILELFYSTGVRRTEMTRLEIGDYDPHARTLLVRRGKGGKSRLLPVGGHAAAWLDHYLSEARPLIAFLPAETGLFLSGYGSAFTPAYLGTWVAKQMKRVGITKPGASHLFRHSCATHMHENGADIRHVQEMLGHARLDTTQIYTHVNIKALQEVHARCHPHGGDPVQEVPASPPGDALTACEVTEMVITAPDAETLKVRPATAARGDDSDRQDEDPPAGSAPVQPKGPDSPQTPKNGEALAANDLQSSPGMQVAWYGYRYYDPVTGRWPSRDPIGERGGKNIYCMLENGLINQVDFLGLARITLDISFIAAMTDGSPVPPENLDPSTWAGLWATFIGEWFPNHQSITARDIILENEEAKNKYYSELLEKIKKAVGDGNCIVKIIIRGHGSSASVGPIQHADLEDPDSPLSKLMAWIKENRCGNGEMVLKSCRAAEGNEGKTQLVRLAVATGFSVSGYTGDFEVIGLGDEYVAAPDGSVSPANPPPPPPPPGIPYIIPTGY
jgi:integrase/recombinase XerD